MKDLYCPLCYSELETIEVAPCMDCGHRANQVQNALGNLKEYAEYRVYEDFILILCDFCRGDFPRYKPEFFGLPRNKRIDTMQFLRSIEPKHIGKDKVCIECDLRLPFLKFVCGVREINEIKYRDK
jgi:hypothetical protein